MALYKAPKKKKVLKKRPPNQPVMRLPLLPTPPDYSDMFDELLTPPDVQQLPAFQRLTNVDPLVDQQLKLQTDPMLLELERARGRERYTFDVQAEKAKGLSEGFLKILTGGKTGDEAQAFAKEKYGGSYLPAQAMAMGQEMLADLTQEFSDKDWQLASQVRDVVSKIPELREQIKAEIMEQEEKREEEYEQTQEQLYADAEKEWERRIKIAGLIMDANDSLFDQELGIAKLDWQQQKDLTAALQKENQLQFNQDVVRTQLGQGATRIKQSGQRISQAAKKEQRMAAEGLRRLEQGDVRLRISDAQLRLAQQREQRAAKGAAKGTTYTVQQVNAGRIAAGKRIASMAEDLRGEAGSIGPPSQGKTGYPNSKPRGQAYNLIYQAEAESLRTFGFTEAQIRAMINIRLDAAGFLRSTPKPKKKPQLTIPKKIRR